MTETFVALLLAHALADFVFQTNWMVTGKRRVGPLLAHGLAVLVTAAVTTGSLSPWLLVLAVAHMAIDLAKAHAPRGARTFLLDQAAHLALIGAFAALLPGLWAEGIWGAFATLPGCMAIAAGLILTTRAGGFAIGLYMEPWAASAPGGLPNGGRAIGWLERALIFLLLLTGQAEGIGFLIAAKSVLRFGAVGDDRAVSEYVIIGTLASFGWAIAVAGSTVLLLSALPPLGIPDLTP